MYYRGGGTGTASTAIAVPKFKQVGLSRTKTGVEIAEKLVLLQSDVTINDSDYVAPLIEALHSRSIYISWERPTRYAHAQLLLALCT